jgi:nucleotide-binding universal stress UspA family protein
VNENGRLKAVVGVDGSAGSLEAVRWVLEEARLRNHAFAALGDTDDVEVERGIVQGPAAQVLIDAVSEHDLLVVGSRGHAAKEQPWTSA